MADTQTLDEFDDEPNRQRSDGRGLWSVLAIAVVVVIVILGLLMLRGCSTILTSADHGSATDRINAVSGAQPVDGKISVWIASGANITQVLGASGVSGDTVDMGGGRFIVSVPTGTEVEAVRKLRDDKDVYDAGRVYSDTSK